MCIQFPLEVSYLHSSRRNKFQSGWMSNDISELSTYVFEQYTYGFLDPGWLGLCNFLVVAMAMGYVSCYIGMNV